MNAKILAEQIFIAGVTAVMPDKIIDSNVFVKDEILFISDLQIELERLENIYVIGAGKANAKMGEAIEKILGDRIAGGQIVVKYGHSCDLKFIKVSEAGHPLPDYNGYAATKKIIEIANSAHENDLLICLISGGGSALLADFPADSSIEELIMLNQLLINSGANIKEMNTVRKHLSKVKGGQLAKVAAPSMLISLVLSDVTGNPLEMIASGPTVPDTTTFSDALTILEKYNLTKSTPATILNHLEKGRQGMHAETPKPGDPAFYNTRNIIVGSNKIALEACKQKAMELGLNSFIITSELEGNTIDIAACLVQNAVDFQKDENIKKPCCLLFGGETTIKVKGSGTGGRNQHLALYAALMLKDKTGITLLAAGTDGNDGPTNVAGAVIDSQTFIEAASQGLDIKKYLDNFDSFHFFEKAGGHVITGPTMTNVMDLIVIIVE